MLRAATVAQDTSPGEGRAGGGLAEEGSLPVRRRILSEDSANVPRVGAPESPTREGEGALTQPPWAGSHTEVWSEGSFGDASDAPQRTSPPTSTASQEPQDPGVGAEGNGSREGDSGELGQSAAAAAAALVPEQPQPQSDVTLPSHAELCAWPSRQLAAWLLQVNLPQSAGAVTARGINGRRLVAITDAELLDSGVTDTEERGILLEVVDAVADEAGAERGGKHESPHHAPPQETHESPTHVPPHSPDRDRSHRRHAPSHRHRDRRHHRRGDARSLDPLEESGSSRESGSGRRRRRRQRTGGTDHDPYRPAAPETPASQRRRSPQHARPTSERDSAAAGIQGSSAAPITDEGAASRRPEEAHSEPRSHPRSRSRRTASSGERHEGRRTSSRGELSEERVRAASRHELDHSLEEASLDQSGSFLDESNGSWPSGRRAHQLPSLRRDDQ